MDTINIINIFDQKILMENVLIMNQLKLLNICKNMFDNFIPKKETLYINEIKDFIDKQNFINWNLFVNLINLESEFTNLSTKTKTYSLKYLIETKSYKIIEFIFDYELDLKQDLINWDKQNKNIFEFIFKKLYQNDLVINKTIDIILKNNYTYLLDKKTESTKSSLNYIISKCSEQIIMRLLELKLIEINWKDNYSNNLVHWACKRNFNNLFNWLINNHSNNFNLNDINKGKRTILHLACIHNNIDQVKILIGKNVELELEDVELKCPLNYAIQYGNSELVKLLLEQNLNLTKNNSEIFYQVIRYQDEQMVKYFIENNYVNIDNTSLFWTTLLCDNKKYYSLMYSYVTKKVFSMFYNFIYEFSNTYDGHYIGDMFYDTPGYYTT